MYQPFASRHGRQRFVPQGCNPHFRTGITCQHGITTVVTLAWSLITGYDRSSLLTVFAATISTLLVPVPFSLQATDYGDIPLGSCKAHICYWGGGGMWSSCISNTFTMSHWFRGLTVCFSLWREKRHDLIKECHHKTLLERVWRLAKGKVTPAVGTHSVTSQDDDMALFLLTSEHTLVPTQQHVLLLLYVNGLPHHPHRMSSFPE